MLPKSEVFEILRNYRIHLLIIEFGIIFILFIMSMKRKRV
jgi:hypothetical protein